MDEKPKKDHRARQAGRKAEKKKKKDRQNETNKPRNPKAFAVNSVRKTAKIVQRNFDLQTKRQHIPVVRRLQVEPPPVIVGVVGPRKVGKTLLIKNLVAHYTKKTLKEIHGPVTVVAGKKNRLTFIECPNDLCATIDLVKVCDVIILMVDATSGFEVDQYELLTLMRTHGETKVIGVLNHLDIFKDKEKLRKARKKIKDRYWKELYKGAKLFNMSGLKGQGKEKGYSKMEILNLSKFILIVALKPRPVEWRNSHPYILADRMEDITDRDAILRFPKCNRRVCLYGYVHGTNMTAKQEIYIPGLGHFTADNVQFREDPCPRPDKEKRRSLTGKERLIYAPMSGAGGVIIDNDATYIDTGGSHSMTQRTEADVKLTASMQELIKPIREIKMFGNGGERGDFSEDGEESDDKDSDDEEWDDKESDEEDEEDLDENDEESSEDQPEKNSIRKDIPWHVHGDNDDDEDIMKAVDDNDEEEEDEEEDGNDLALRANRAFKDRMKKKVNLMKIIYGEVADSPGSAEEEEVGDTDKNKGSKKEMKLLQVITDRKERDKRRLACHQEEMKKDTTEINLDMEDEETFVQNFRSIFGRVDAGAEAVSRLREDDELYGDFEDLEGDDDKNAGHDKYEDDDDDEDENDDEDEEVASEDDKKDDEDDGEEEGEVKKSGNVADECMGPHELARKRKASSREERRLAKKMRLKEKFNQLYDNKEDNSFYESWKAETTAQAEMNMTEFQDMEDDQRVQIEGFRPGMYVRVEIADMPCEFVEYYNPDFPVVVGGVQSTEGNVGYVQGTFQKHKWFAKEVLKTTDPVIISAGWWRFQTLAYYSKLEDNMRHRYLKYSSRDYGFCHITFWGPLMAPKTGFVAMQTVKNVKPFRIAGTGAIVTLDKSINIEKKLKLVGNVSKIFKKSAFIEGMFNSPLEVAKFHGALIKTQAGVRGHVKKPISKGPPGSFRATFEDRILKSDIVFLNAWYTVEVRKFYLPVSSLLLPRDEKSTWQGMRTVGELRHQLGLSVPVKKDSLYREVNRPVQRLPELRIPKAVMKELPFKDTPKNLGPMSVAEKRVAVIRDAREKKVASLVSRLQVLYEHKRRVDRQKMRERAQKHQKERSMVEGKKLAKQRERKKHAFRKLGLKQPKSSEAS